MTNKIYVGNLNYDLTEKDLIEIFNSCGTIKEARIVQDFFTGESRGFGFVLFSRPEEAEKAISLNGLSVKGRKLRVDLSSGNRRFQNSPDV